MTTWTRYTQLARQLDDVYRERERQAADQAANRQAVDIAVGQLDHRLGAQRQRLDRLAGLLGWPLGAPPAGYPAASDPSQALQLARQHADLADTEATEAEQLAQQPPLLPTVSAQTRNLLVYAGCALVAIAATFALIAVSDLGHLGTLTLLGSICAGFPILAWVAGYAILTVWGRPRLGDREVSRSPRLGLAVCLLAVPVAACAFALITSVL